VPEALLAERFAERQDVDLDRSYFYTDSITDLPVLERVASRASSIRIPTPCGGAAPAAGRRSTARGSACIATNKNRRSSL